jgi:hypothetical protein
MQDRCGLVNAANPCRCAKKTQAFMRAGYVDPHNLLFAKDHVIRVREVAPKVHEDMESLDEAYAAIHRDHPFHTPRDFVAAIKRLIDGPDFQSVLNPEQR